MAEIPENETMWNTYKAQAMSMYPSHGRIGQLSPAAAKWLKNKYLSSGGSFVGSQKEVPLQFRDVQKEKQEAKIRKEKRLRAARKKAGLL